MSLLAATLFLSVLMLAQAHHHEDPADNLDRPPLGQHLYLFDVYSEADTENVTRCMDKLGLTVLHRFKEVGVRHYYFVVVAPNVEDSRKLKFPKDSRVTSIPLQHLSDYFQMFGVDNWTYPDTEDALPDEVLHLDEWEFLFPQGTSTAEFMSMMAAYAGQYTAAESVVRAMAYGTPARYPPKIYYFANIEDNALQYLVRDGLDAVGGPANVKVTIRHLVKI